MSDYVFVKQMYKWGFDIIDYLTAGAITQFEYNEIMNEKENINEK